MSSFLSSASRLRRSSRSLATLAVAALLSACSSGYVTIPETSPARIPALETRVTRSPDDVRALSELGAAYRQADRPEDARRVLEHAREVAPDEPVPVVLLGLAYEELEAYTSARELYEEYLELVPESRIRGRLEGRIQTMRRLEFEVLVSEALASEASLEAEPAPTHVAVFPFRYEGDDPGLSPLGYALGGMVATDLAQVNRLTLLERLHLEELMREIELGESDLVDRSTAARSGRLLGAGRVVQGRLGGSEASVDLEAAAVRVTAADPEVTPVAEQDALERVFDMEKSVVLGLIDAMGITLTAAERERVLERRTENLQALLAYGRGLQASRRGAYAEAEAHFEAAVELDPGFEEAAVEGEITADLVEGAADPEEVVTGAVRDVQVPLPPPGEVTGGPPVVEPPTLTDPPPVPGHPEELPDPPETRRDPPEILGGEKVLPLPVVIIDIILRRPGGTGGGR